MTCDSRFRDGDHLLHACARPNGHGGLCNDGRNVRWNGTWVTSERTEDQ